jgi:hypothetical protein
MTQPPTVPPPPSGLGSNSNYFLNSNCKPILDLSVTINVTQDIVCESSSAAVAGFSAPGFGFQLNAYSPIGETSAWQQYVICHSEGDLSGAIENWPLTGDSIINETFDLASTPDVRTLPAGYQLQIILKNSTLQTSWDLAVTGDWAGPGNSGLLLYDRVAGSGAFYAVGSQGEMTLLQEYDGWRTSWDLAVTGDWGGPGNSGLLLYDRAAGSGAFYAVGSQGEMTLLADYEGWRTSWDLAMTGGWGGPGNSGLLLYDRAAWTGAFYAIDSHATMSLLAECHSRSIIGATYIVTDNEGKDLSNVTMDLTSFTGVTPDELSPIIAFELNLVGPFNGESTVLSSGAGTIVYHASAPLTVLSQEPPCAESNYSTAETANSIYGSLPVGPDNTFTQSFNMTHAAMIRKEGKRRPSLTIPAR